MKMLVLLCAALISGGCVSIVYQGESFPPTDSVAVLPFNSRVPAGYQVIGQGSASGEFSAVTRSELREKLRKSAMEHGADAIKIIGTRIVPEGFAVNTGSYNFAEATDDPDQLGFEDSAQEVISGAPNRGSERYKLIMYAEFLRKKAIK